MEVLSKELYKICSFASNTGGNEELLLCLLTRAWW